MKGVELQIEGLSHREAARQFGIDPRTVANSVGRMDCSADAGGDADGFALENNWRAKKCANLNGKASRGLVIREVRLQESGIDRSVNRLVVDDDDCAHVISCCHSLGGTRVVTGSPGQSQLE
jgi:hypothetical protein